MQNTGETGPHNYREEADGKGKCVMAAIATYNFKKWNGYQWASGGLLNYEKCFWYLLKFRWKGGRVRYATSDEAPGAMTVPAADDPARLVTIPRLEPARAQRTLGVYIAPDGNCKEQMSVLVQKATEWAKQLGEAKLPGATRWIAYSACVKDD